VVARRQQRSRRSGRGWFGHRSRLPPGDGQGKTQVHRYHARKRPSSA
jgi:hypothetical protein